VGARAVVIESGRVCTGTTRADPLVVLIRPRHTIPTSRTKPIHTGVIKS